MNLVEKFSLLHSFITLPLVQAKKGKLTVNGYRLSRYLGKKSIVNYKIIDGGLRRESKFIGLSSKSMARLTHPTKYNILLSP